MLPTRHRFQRYLQGESDVAGRVSVKDSKIKYLNYLPGAHKQRTYLSAILYNPQQPNRAIEKPARDLRRDAVVKKIDYIYIPKYCYLTYIC